jgi:hypothetical protein
MATVEPQKAVTVGVSSIELLGTTQPHCVPVRWYKEKAGFILIHDLKNKHAFD